MYVYRQGKNDPAPIAGPMRLDEEDRERMREVSKLREQAGAKWETGWYTEGSRLRMAADRCEREAWAAIRAKNGER